MQLIVIPETDDPRRGTLTCGDLRFSCALGRNGVSGNKREGDGATPVGEFLLRNVLYRADKGIAPRTALPHRAIAPRDGWCDDPADPAYNRPVLRPYPARSEALWRDDDVYDVVVVVGHNDDPVVPGAGSAIFLHIAKPDLAPTEGCVALRRDNVMAVLERCGPGDTLIVQSVGGS